MRDGDDGDGPEYRANGISRKVMKILCHLLGRTVQFAHYRGIDVLQAPSRHHGIISRDEKSRDDTHQSHEFPCRAVGQFAVSARRIGCSMAADDELADHTGDAEQHATNINQDECRAAVLSRHIWETPHVAQSYSRTGGGEYPQVYSQN